tara:strand:+ start:4856 stop:5113 length:258 start_codon:yes stop_codon:yes gene_type:complete
MSSKFKDNKIKNLQRLTLYIWDKYYVSQQKGNWVGNEYPSEPLIRYITNLIKDYKNKITYFDDEGKELNIKKILKVMHLKSVLGL